MDMNLSNVQEIREDRGGCLAAVHGAAESDTTAKEQQQWIDSENWIYCIVCIMQKLKAQFINIVLQ